MSKLKFISKAKRILQRFADDEKIGKASRKLLKGFYTSNKYEIDPYYKSKYIADDNLVE